MSPLTTYSFLSVASLIGSSFAFPLNIFEVRKTLEGRRPEYSVVNVDGSSSPSTTSLPQTVTQTVSELITKTASPTETMFVATVNVDRGSTTETVYVTVTPIPFSTPTPSPSSTTSTVPSVAPIISPIETKSSSTIAPISSLSTGTPPNPPCDGAPWRTLIPLKPSGVFPPGVKPTGAYLTGAYPSGIPTSFPPLPFQKPKWFNSTEVPSYKKRTAVS